MAGERGIGKTGAGLGGGGHRSSRAIEPVTSGSASSGLAATRTISALAAAWANSTVGRNRIPAVTTGARCNGRGGGGGTRSARSATRLRGTGTGGGGGAGGGGG